MQLSSSLSAANNGAATEGFSMSQLVELFAVEAMFDSAADLARVMDEGDEHAQEMVTREEVVEALWQEQQGHTR
jgi:hypothetical protein